MKKFFKFILKGLISNEEVIDGSKKYPLWAGIIALLFSTILSVVPSFVSIAQTQGSTVITSGTNASLDVSLPLLSKYLVENNLDITVKEDGKLDLTKEINPNGTDKDEYLIKAQGRTLLAVRIIKTVDDEQTADNEEVKAIEKYREMYASGKLTLDGSVSTRPVSNLLFTENFVYLTTYQYTDSVVNTVEDGKITSYAQTNSTFAGLTKCTPNKSIKSFYNIANDKPLDSCLNSWKVFFNDLYSESKTQYLWTYSGILVALNVGVSLVVSLLVMILTRLKSATGDKMNYFQALNTVSFAAICPAILTIALGFLIPQISQIGFILLLGLRSTFLGMKAANPTPRQ